MSNDKDQFEELIRQILPNRLITNFILIAEIIDSDDEELSVNVSNGMTPWLAQGMIRYAETMLRNREDELSDDEED